MKNFKLLTAMTIVMVLGFATYSFAAGKGNRSGRGGEWLKNCPAAKNLSNEDRQKVQNEIQAFRNDADSIRQQIRQKRSELKNEMKKPSTDSQKAFALQKEISDLEAQIAQKRVQYLINLKNINPALSECLDRGAKMGRKRAGVQFDQNTDK